MVKIGLIGAGNISKNHLRSYAANPYAKVVAIADLNEGLAKERAEEFGIERYYTDYKKILDDEEIHAVSIVTPTFTHSNITIEALKAGKHVLCEKPPALTVKETEQMVKTAEETGKLLMFAFVCRFKHQISFLKEYIDSGKMGQIYHADLMRLGRYNVIDGWFVDKQKSGGGMLMDAAIHQIDEVMYLMGYPKVKEVLGFATDINNDMVGKIKGQSGAYVSLDRNHYERTIESMSSGYVTLDNGAVITIKAGSICYSISNGNYIELIGKDGGMRMEGDEITLLSNINDYMVETKPLTWNGPTAFETEINHFVDCCLNNTPCICQEWQAIELMKIIEGIYQSAATGQSVRYK